MLHNAGAPRSAETIRIVTVGMGKLGGMVARQLIRSQKDAECILGHIPGEVRLQNCQDASSVNLES